MTKRIPKLEYYTDAIGEHRWMVRASNGKVISESSEGYNRKKACERSVDITFCAIREHTALTQAPEKKK